ncbi:hypothetical protein [Burkholderia territorii]|nr:hypothetical protein [Burkholderia territorii]
MASPQIKTCERITDSTLLVQCPAILVLPMLEIVHQRPVSPVFAGYYMRNGDGPGLARVFKVEFHFGRASWCFSVEHSAQIATQYQFGTLRDSITCFEKATYVELPDVPVFDYGIGVYGAKSLSTADNPFALVDGGRYEVHSRARGVRRFVANIRNGRTLLSFITSEGALESRDTYEPHIVLGIEDWKSLTAVQS